MAYEPKEGSGALFKNDKGDNPARPDYRGDVMVGGVLYELSAWIKPLPSDASRKFMSLSAKPKQQNQQQPQRGSGQRPVQQPQRQAPQRQAARNGGRFDDMDDIPY